MEKLVSNKLNILSVPESYVFPPEKRPGNLVVPLCETIPVVDLGKADGSDRTEVIRQILKASQEFGFFQVINHGILVKMMHDTLNVAMEFFEMPLENKASLFSDDPKQTCRVYTSVDYNNEEIHYWRDNLKHPSHPLEECIHSWPEKPARYREVVGTYSIAMRRLGLSLLELICEGLGLELGYFGDKYSKTQILSINYYPPCPDPGLTLGLPKHSDPNLITLLLQQEDVNGLQIFNDGKWIAMKPVTNALVVNLGHQLQIISNGRLRSVEHRVVTNSKVARTTVATFFYPSVDSIIEPASALVNPSSPPLYRAFQYKEFLHYYVVNSGDTVAALEPFKLQ